MANIATLAQGPANPVLTSGSANSLGAGGAVVTATTPPAGRYRIHVFTRATAATAADQALDHNMELRKGATVLVGKLLSGLNVRGGYCLAPGLVTDLDGSTNVSVNATAATAGGASTTYAASLILERVA